ncbi:hypothetical protein BKA63DRAFT_501680 [Paraphoma chrysanthemicola]|nr:hypothetical protein BKA63DRAFT_501680 [Paraphoma chrysanthemicola]
MIMMPCEPKHALFSLALCLLLKFSPTRKTIQVAHSRSGTHIFLSNIINAYSNTAPTPMKAIAPETGRTYAE